MTSSPLLSVRNLVVDFHTSEGVTRAVNNISFDIPAGKTIGIVGESGSGKSVTSLAVMGLLQKPAAKIPQGEILFNGQDLLKFNDAQMRDIRGNQISMIFQEPMTSLNPVFKVGDQIAETIRIHRQVSKKEAWDRAVDLMNQVGIPNPSASAHKYPHEMSGGQKQRVMIAMAIACEPKLLICDEPTTALDVTIQKQVLDLLHGLQQKHHMSMMFITHDLGVIGDIADDVVVMYRSNVVEKNNAKEIFYTAKHPYTKGLLACRPKLGANPRRLLTVSDFMDDNGVEKHVSAERVQVFEKEDEPNRSDEILLEVKNLVTQFPIKGGLFGRTVDHFKAVNDVSFTLKKGQTLGLVGESGCGKTTLGRSILRLIEPASGNIIYNGKDITQVGAEELRLLRRKMQIIFQDPYSSLNPRMTVAEILTEPLNIHNVGSGRQERLDMAKQLFEKVGLKAAQLNRYPHEFSGGQRQRICIARALMLRPEFVICDESVSALDVSVQAQVLNLLLDLQEEFGLTYVFISHDLGVVNFIADEVGVMNKGKIIEMDKASQIYKNPKEEYTRALLSAIPKGEGKANLAALV
ncbi:ABC transporter ATP-binding protein [Peredibacter starrii]|uniref:ABC transporter ATP-binding protein n=1 Tax=Peredibacter starrii TaxID=28202 RepID=A0AAX4HRX9_9BACT|nr:ABC transporter ATP-binding protein [Peredibacter starrii]WPU65981.1 ABC transporter ATP-binding protein [Peredibacter starrii]